MPKKNKNLVIYPHKTYTGEESIWIVQVNYGDGFQNRVYYNSQAEGQKQFDSLTRFGQKVRLVQYEFGEVLSD